MRMDVGPDADVEQLARQMKAERERRGWSAETLAERARHFATEAGLHIKLTQQSISNFEVGGAKRVPVWLRYVKEAFEQPTQDDLDRAATAGHQDKDLVYVRQVDIRYAMGAGAVVEDYPSTGAVPFNLQFLRALGAKSTDTLLLARGDGDSMVPTLINDDLVLIDTAQQIIHESDRIWAVVVGGGGMIKRVRRLPRDQYQIISDNPIVPPQTVEHDDLHVVGRVVWVGRRI